MDGDPTLGYTRTARRTRFDQEDPGRRRYHLLGMFPHLIATSRLCILTKIKSQLYEVQAQHAFIRDTSSKGRWDAALTRSLFGNMMEMFERCVARDLGKRVRSGKGVEHVC